MDYCYAYHYAHQEAVAPQLPSFSMSAIWMLGKCYEPAVLAEDFSLYTSVGDSAHFTLLHSNRKRFAQFLEDFRSRLWMTYRRDFPRIEPTNYTSDMGWGCMLRSGQMLLAQAFCCHYLGRDWRKNSETMSPAYAKVIEWFADDPKYPYSIHNIAQSGLKFGKNVGEWFGPSTIAQVLEELVMEHHPSLKVYVSLDGCLYLDQIEELCFSSSSPRTKRDCQSQCAREPEDWKPLVIIIPLRLGLETINEDYIPTIKQFFHFPQSLGIIGGKPRASLYFVAYQDEHVFYLDPHTVQAAYKLNVNSSENSSNDQKSLMEQIYNTHHTDVPLSMPIRDMDPSLAVAFYCKSKEDWEDFQIRVQKWNNSGDGDGMATMMVFNIMERAPDYLVKKKPPKQSEKFFSDDDDDDDIVFL